MSPKFKVGDSVSLKSDPTDAWLVIKVFPATHYPPSSYRIVNPYDHERTVFESEIEPAPGTRRVRSLGPLVDIQEVLANANADDLGLDTLHPSVAGNEAMRRVLCGPSLDGERGIEQSQEDRAEDKKGDPYP